MNPIARIGVYTRRAAAGLLLVGWAVAVGAQEARFTVDPTMARGPAAAPVTIFEWSDYECPYCRNAQEMLQRLQGEFPDTVRLVYKDFPLASHPGALPAAMAARCAGVQGRFWEYHDLLFVSQPAFARADLVGYARRLGLDVGAFTECFDSGRFRDAVLADQREGREAGVRGTPTFFINQRKIEGALPIEDLRAAVQRALRESGR